MSHAMLPFADHVLPDALSAPKAMLAPSLRSRADVCFPTAASTGSNALALMPCSMVLTRPSRKHLAWDYSEQLSQKLSTRLNASFAITKLRCFTK